MQNTQLKIVDNAKQQQEYSTSSTFNDGLIKDNQSSSYTSKLYDKNMQNQHPKTQYQTPANEETEAQCDDINDRSKELLNKDISEDASPNTNQKMSETLFEEQQNGTTQISKKPNFSVVCMLPSKQPRASASLNQNLKDKNYTIIEKQTLARILQLQQQYRESRGNSSSNYTNYNNNFTQQTQQHQNSYMHQQSSANSSAYNIQSSTYSSTNNFYNSSPSKHSQSNQQQQQQQQSNKIMSLQMDKVGLCGIPSLWMQKEELIKEKHISQETLNERERLDKLLRILQIHKKYENEKYFGGQGIYKRGTQQQTSNITGGQGGSSFINQDYVQFSTQTVIQRQKGQSRDEKINSIVKDEIQQNQPTEGSNQQVQVFPQIRNYDNPDQLLFKIQQAEAKLVRLILESHGFLHTESNDWNLLWTCTSSQQKPYMYENLNENQKINHFVNSSELTRKDRLCYNVGKMQMKFGRNHFDFLPETYILPDEFSEFYKSFNSTPNNENEKNLWIVKPSSSSQGKGIFMIDDISEVPLNESLVISKYIGNPLLINGLKFDLRLYVLVTSFDPLKIYIYNEGLVRFASEPYDISNTKQNVYAHLTNYSINKKSEHFIQNKNIAQRDFGNKWSLSALQTHLQNLGIDMKIVWERIYDSIIKSLLSIESHVFNALKKIQNINNTQNKSNSFDLFGFDIILDSDLKPWILEVNLSPSLAFDSPLDFHIKSNLLVDAFNIVGLKKFSRRRDFLGKQLKVKSNNNQQNNQSNNQVQQNDQKKRYQSALNMSQLNTQNTNQSLNKTDTTNLAQNLAKQNLMVDQVIQKNQYEGIDIIHVEKLSKISAKHRELLREHLEEFSRNKKQNFTRIFPTPGSSCYDVYFEQPRPLNKLLYKYLYQQNELQDIINLINRSQQKASQQTYQEPYSDSFILNHNSSTQSINKQEKKSSHHLNQQNSYISEHYDQFKPETSELDLQLKQNRSSSMSSIQKDSQANLSAALSPKAQIKFKQDTYQNEQNLNDEPALSPLQKRRLDEKRSVTSNKKKEESHETSTIKLPLNPLLSSTLKSKPQSSTISRNSGGQTSNNLENSPVDISQIKEQDDKVIITGDDILIEYVKRVMLTVKLYQSEISTSSIKKLEQFLTHKVWYSKNQQNRQADSQSLWQRIETKYIEMQERKKRLFIKKQQQEGISSNQSDKLFLQNEKLKEDIIKDFTSNELEQMLIQSNKNNQIEVVSILLCGQNSLINGMYYTSGILTKIEKEAHRLSKNSSQVLKLMKINVDQNQISNINDHSQSMYSNANNDNFYGSPKEANNAANTDKSQILTRMRTSEYDKNAQLSHQQIQSQQQQYNPFNYKTQQSTYEQLHSSYSHHKSNTNGKNSVLYQSSSASSKQSLLQQKSSKKQNQTVDRDFSLKESEKKITLPSINNNHLSQDYSRISIQLNNNNTQNAQNSNAQLTGIASTEQNNNDKLSKYRLRAPNEKSFFIKKVRQQSLQSEQQNSKQSSIKIARNQANTKFERLDI